MLFFIYIIDGPIPNLDYIEEPTTASFKSDGGKFPSEEYRWNDYYGLSIFVPPNAVPKGQEIQLRIGVCCYGPFSIDEKYEVASDFVVIVADREFDQPVKVLLEHCLLLQDYNECEEVRILKASHQRDVKNLFAFNELSTLPTISSTSSNLCFEINEFCILCSAIKQNEQMLTSQDSMPSSPSHIDDDNPSSAPSSFDDDMKLERSSSTESQVPIMKSLSISSSSESLAEPSSKRKTGSLESDAPRPRKRLLAKKKVRRRTQSERVEFNAILFQNKKISSDPYYQFVISICRSCPASREVKFYSVNHYCSNKNFITTGM